MTDLSTRQPNPSASVPRFGAAGRAAKLLPPSDPPGTLDRVELEDRLADAIHRRLTVVVAGAGFGKSTLAAHVAARLPSAWYTLDASDRQLGTLAAGIAAALRTRLDLPEDLTRPVEDSLDPTDEGELLDRAQAAAALLADAVQEHVTTDVVLVLDDLHAIDDAPVAWRFIEALVRQAPAELHLFVTSRTELLIMRSQTAASGNPTTIQGMIIEPSQPSGSSANGTYFTGMKPMPETAIPVPNSSSVDSPTT